MGIGYTGEMKHVTLVATVEPETSWHMANTFARQCRAVLMAHKFHDVHVEVKSWPLLSENWIESSSGGLVISE